MLIISLSRSKNGFSHLKGVRTNVRRIFLAFHCVREWGNERNENWMGKTGVIFSGEGKKCLSLCMQMT